MTKAAPRKNAAKKTAAGAENGKPERPNISEWAHELRSDYLQCRDFGHSWRPYTAHWDPTEHAYDQKLRCSRCKTIRTRWISRTGEQLGAHYEYAKGYMVKGIGRLTGQDRDWVRLESVLRVLPEDADEEDTG